MSHSRGISVSLGILDLLSCIVRMVRCGLIVRCGIQLRALLRLLQHLTAVGLRNALSTIARQTNINSITQNWEKRLAIGRSSN